MIGGDESPEASDRWCGDWLLTFHRNDARFPARHDAHPWRSVHRSQGSELRTQAIGGGWLGAPWTTYSDDEWQIWVLGEAYTPPHWRQVVAGQRSAETLNGHFLLLARERASGDWHVWTDRFGTLHAYYASGSAGGVVGTYALAVAQASQRTLDWLGLTSFFACGFFLQDRTHFENVKILRPATHYVFDADGQLRKHERYWEWQYRPDRRRSYAETVEIFGDTLEQVIADQISADRVALPISGGLDSRSTVAALTDRLRDQQVTSYSYGYGKRSVETTIARRIAEARHLPFHCFQIDAYFFDRLDSVLRVLEGFLDLTLSRQAAVVSELAPLADFLIAAHWGDVWLDSAGGLGLPTDSETISRHALQRIEKPGGQWLLDQVCKPQLRDEDPRNLVFSMVHQEMESVAHIEDADYRIKAFKTDQWSFRWTTSSLRMFQAAAFPRLPFYDTRLTDFFSTVPSEYMQGRRLQIDYLKQHAPDLARITWEEFDANLYWAPYFDSWLLPKRAAKMLWRVLTRPRKIERNWEIQFAGNAGRRGLEHWLLRPGLHLHEFVPRREIESLLNGFSVSPPDGRRGNTVASLLTFSAWLQHHD